MYVFGQVGGNSSQLGVVVDTFKRFAGLYPLTCRQKRGLFRPLLRCGLVWPKNLPKQKVGVHLGMGCGRLARGVVRVAFI